MPNVGPTGNSWLYNLRQATGGTGLAAKNIWQPGQGKFVLDSSFHRTGSRTHPWLYSVIPFRDLPIDAGLPKELAFKPIFILENGRRDPCPLFTML